MAIFFAMPGNEGLTEHLARISGGEAGAIEVRSFPDGESYVRVLCDVKGSEAFLVRTLARPDPQFLALCFAAATIKDLGAARLQLIARYVAYMRQGGIFIRARRLRRNDLPACFSGISKA